MVQVTLEDAKSRLVELIEAVEQGETIVIAKDSHPVAQIQAIETAERRPHFGSAKGSVWMADDFDAPLDDFAEYMK
jgi:prevent-host-death family protein